MTTQKSVEAQLESLSDQLDKILEKQNKEQVFAEQANNQFEKNIKAFEKFFPEIAEKYISYQPNEKFDLFLNENGSANIVDYNTSLPMYSEAPIEQVAKQVKKNIDHPIIGRVDHSNVVKIDNPASFIHIELMKSIGEVYNTAKEQLDDNFKVDSSVPSIMIFGVGLGYHLEEILSYTKSGFVSIFEPNEDYFFASLFVCPWYSILELIDNNDSFLYLGIGLDESEIYEQVYTRSKEVGSLSVCHTWFYQHYPSLEVNKLIAEFKKNYHQFFAGFGFFDDALLGIAHTLGNIENSVPLLKNHGVIDENLHKLPAVVVANGPSLDSEIEFLQAVQNDVVIFSCNSASTALCKNAITPDFHVALERTESTYQFLSEHLPENVRANLNLLIPNVMHPKVAGLFKWAGMGLKPAEAGTQLLQLAQYKRDGEFSKTISFCNPLVGNTALSFVTHLGFSEVYLVGVDNGYIDQEHHHSKDSFYYDEKGNTKVTPYKLGKEFRVAGNFCDEVITDEFMNVGNTQMSRLLAHYRKQGGYCYNLSNGAKINNSYPLRSHSTLIKKYPLDIKRNVITYIKEQKFQHPLPVNYIEELLSFQDFNDFCKTMASILEKPAQSKECALNNLLESLRYLYSFRNSRSYLALFLLLEGEALYVSTILVSLLYNFGEEDEVLPFYNNALQFWIKFIHNAPAYYEENFRLCK